MNLPLFLPGIGAVILLLFGVFIGVAVYLLKCKFKNTVLGKCLVVSFLSLAGLVLAYTLSYAIASLIGRYQINAQLAEMRKQGIPSDENDIIPPMPKNASDNGAVLYNQAFALMDGDADISKLYDLESGYDLAEWSDKNRETAQRVLDSKKMEKIFSLFRQGTEKPCVVFHSYQGIETQFPGLVNQRALFRLISLKSSSYGLNGNPEAGYSLICDGFKTIKQLESDPFLISQLVNIALAKLNIEAINSLIFRYGISSQTAGKLMSGLNKINFNEAIANSMGGELLLNKDLIKKIIAGKSKIPDYLNDNSLHGFIEKYGPWPVLYQNYARYLRLMLKTRKLYSQPYWLVERQIKELENEIPKDVFSISFPALNLQIAQIESEIDAAKLTLALHIYKNQNGAFPDKLEQLAPGILKEIPVDPISGKPFEYQKADGKVTLSSVWLKEKAEEDRKRQEQNRREQEKRNRNKTGK
ncbi:MAG: hypothetical protein WCI51_03170 [Lentisphaerota bacterium]